jgi:N-acetylmuramoyl-L-alanine amidase CwlA
MLNYKLNEKKIGTANVIVDILPKGKVIPNVKMTPTSITIHNTGNIGAPAKNNHNYMKNCNKNGSRIASWHFTVDDKEIYQAQSTNYKCYHAGCSTGNNTSIGIEICMFNDKERQRKAYLNAIELVKILMQHHGFKISQVKQHYNWTKKDCPTWLRSGKFGFTWNWFIEQCKGETKNISEKNPVVDNKEFLIKVIYEGKEGLNIRKEPNSTSKIMGQVYKGGVYTIVEVKNNWGKLKSGLGWINLNEKYVKRQ